MNLKVKRNPQEKLFLSLMFLFTVQSGFYCTANIKSLLGGLVVRTKALESKNFQVLICQRLCGTRVKVM